MTLEIKNFVLQVIGGAGLVGCGTKFDEWYFAGFGAIPVGTEIRI